MFVNVKAVRRENHPGVWTPGRFWPSSEAVRVEVTKDEPEMIDEDVFHEGRKVGTRKIVDPTKISEATLKGLKEDGRVSIFEDGKETDDSSKVAALEAENARLKEINDGLSARVAELESQAAEESAAPHKSARHAK
jgi:hypothetical protein